MLFETNNTEKNENRRLNFIKSLYEILSELAVFDISEKRLFSYHVTKIEVL